MEPNVPVEEVTMDQVFEVIFLRLAQLEKMAMTVQSDNIGLAALQDLLVEKEIIKLADLEVLQRKLADEVRARIEERRAAERARMEAQKSGLVLPGDPNFRPPPVIPRSDS